LPSRQHGLASLAVDGQRQLVVVSITFMQADGRRNTKPPMQQSPETLAATLGRQCNFEHLSIEQPFFLQHINN
jgi:hypothetical protein